MYYTQPNNDPQNFYWYQEGFTKEELDRIYQGVSNLSFEKASLLGGADAEGQVRSSSVKWIPQNEEWLWLYERLMKYAADANNSLWHFDLIGATELIQYTEYYASEGGHYDWHQDIGPGDASRRKISITVQLSEPDEYEGGDLEIWAGGQDLRTAARGAGVVYIFPSYMMHRVSKVTKGTRKSFVIWIGGQHYR